MKNANAEIVKYKVSNLNKKGKRMKNQIKLSGVDIFGKEHYLKFVSYDFAVDLISAATPGEVEHDICYGSLQNPWIENNENI